VLRQIDLQQAVRSLKGFHEVEQFALLHGGIISLSEDHFVRLRRPIVNDGHRAGTHSCQSAQSPETRS
jgi:hypothetical protein